MKRILLIAIIVTFASSIKVPYKDGVYSLNDTNFEEFIHESNYNFVNFFDKNCSESQRLVEPFFHFAEKIRDTKTPVKVCKIDISKNIETGNAFGIEKTPTFALLIDSYALPYDGTVAKDHIYNWTISKLADNVTEIVEDDIAESIMENNDKMKLIFNNQDSLYDLKNITTISKFFDDEIWFFYTQKASIAKKFKMSMGTRFVLYNDGDAYKFKGDTSVESMFSFIEESKKPLVEQLTEENIDNLMDDELYNATFVAILKKRDSLEKTKKLLKKFKRNEKYKDISFTWVYQDDRSVGDQLIEFVGRKPKEFSFGILVKSHGENLVKYLMNKRITEDNVKNFIEKYKKGTLQKLMKSDSEPKYNDEAWKIWTGRSFPKNYKKNKQDLLFFFWAKGCTNCPQFNKIFQRLSIRLESKNPNLLFVKVDGANNDVEEFEFTEFPQVVFVPANNRTERHHFEVTYDGTERSLYEFLESKATFPWVKIEVPVPKPIVEEVPEDEDKKPEGKKNSGENEEKEEQMTNADSPVDHDKIDL